MFVYGNASKQSTLINWFYVSLICDNTHNNTVITALSQQQCHNNTVTTTVTQQQYHNNTVTTTVPQQQCHNSKYVTFQENRLKVLKCYNFVWVQQQRNCSPAASFANCVMTLYLLKVHLQMFLSIPITQKCQILSCDTLVHKWAIFRQQGYLPNF